MIKILATIVILLGSVNLIAQPNFTAIITDPQIGIEANADKLIEVVNDINKRNSISLVVVIGNITANGKFDEFIWAQEILDRLQVPYYVIGGEKDYTLSEGKGNEIALLWGDDKFWIEKNNEIHIGFNNFFVLFNRHNSIEIETRNWIANNFSKMDATKKVKIFYYSFNEILGNLFWLGGGPNFFKDFEFVGNPKTDDNSNELFVPKSLSNQLIWMYNFINSRQDSLFIYNITKIDSTPSVTYSLSPKDWQFQIPIPLLEGHRLKYKFISKISLETSIFAKPILLDKEIYLCTKNGSVLCLDQSGDEKWKYETNGTIYSLPLVEGDLVIAATNEGDLFTINKNTGNVFQVIGIGESITSDVALTDLEYEGMQTKGIVFGTAEGNFYCYELYSLQLVWWNQSAKNWINSSVTTDKGKIFFQNKNGTLYCLSSANGSLLWKWKSDTKDYNPLYKSDIIVANNNICFVDFDGDLHCIDALLGTKKWSLRKLNASGKIVVNEIMNEVILHTEKDKILRISLISGKIIKEFDLPSSVENEIAVDILMINDTVYTGFTDGSVYELNKKFKAIFSGNAPVISLNKINGNLLVTDYDGNLTLLDLQKEKK